MSEILGLAALLFAMGADGWGDIGTFAPPARQRRKSRRHGERRGVFCKRRN